MCGPRCHSHVTRDSSRYKIAHCATHSSVLRIMSVSSMSDVSSLDEVDSELSYDDDVKVSPTPRRHSHRSAALFAAHAQATASTPMRVSTPLRAPSIRSSPSMRRPVTAPAPETAPLESVDRLKHLKTHMKQLRKLYNQEVHLEELVARDAFLQTMCTSGITLFRHCASRQRFFIAVKALLCQYLLASNAKLIQVERSSSSKCFLVLQDNQSFEVAAESELIGIAGNAAHAMLLMKDGDPTSPNLSRSSSSDESSAASEARTSDEVAYSSAWLKSHADCILPTTNGHLLLLFPAHALYRLGFHQEIDLATRKKGADGAQLLVMGLKSVSGYPIGIVEAILPSDVQCNVEFLDAFGVLLATALESRLAICRSVVDKLEIQVVDSHGEQFADATSNQSPVLSVPLLGNRGRIELFGGAAVLPEQDEALVRAFQKSLTRLCSENRDLRRQAHGFERSLVGLGHLWRNLSSDGTLENNWRGPVCGKWRPVRAYFSNFMDRLVADCDSPGGADDSVISVQVRFLFRGETKDVFKRAYAVDDEHVESDSSSFPGADGHFSILQQVMDSAEAFETGETMLVLPIRDEELQQCEENTNGVSQRAAAAMILILPTASDPSSTMSTFSKMMKLHVAHLLIQFAEHLLLKMKQKDRVHELQQRLEAMSEHEVAITAQITDGMILKDVTQQLLMCSSLEELVLCVNSIAASSEDVRSKFARATLFVASTKETYTGRRKSITSVWSVAEDMDRASRKKLELFDERNPDEVRGCGIPSFVLFTQEPLSYTGSHHAFSPTRQNEHDWFYAVPLNVSANEKLLGVLDFAFESESQRERFLGDPLLLNAMTEVLTQFIALHQQFSGKEDRIRREVQELKDLQSQVLEKWLSFVTKWSSLPLGDFEAWKREATLLLCELLPSNGYFVNVLYSVQTQTDEENAAVRTILSDASHPPHSSNTLNVLNQAILSRCMAFPLSRRPESREENEVIGVLAFSKKDDEPFTSEEKQLGSMASCLLSHQVMLFKQKHEHEIVMKDYEERITKQLATIAQAKDSNEDLAADLRTKQSLLQVSSIRFDELVSSRSIEQLCEIAIQSISKSSGTVFDSVKRALSDKSRSEVSVLVFDADHQSFTLAGREHHGTTISAGTEGTHMTGVPWFSAHRISTHKPPFATLPSELVNALPASFMMMDSIAIVPVCRNGDSQEREVFALIVMGNGNKSLPTTDDYLLGLAECFSKVFRMKRECDKWDAKQRHLEGTISGLETQKQATDLWSELFNLAYELWCELLQVLSSHGNPEEWKSRLNSQVTASLIKILRHHVELTRVELTVCKERSKLDATANDSELLLGPNSVFTKILIVSGEKECFLGLLCVVWKPLSSKLQEDMLVALLEWISMFLRDLLHHCIVFEKIQARVSDTESQCSRLTRQVDEDTDMINRLAKVKLQWHSVQDVVCACASIAESRSEFDIVDGDSPWYRLFATIRSIGGVTLKLWLVDDANALLWTLMDGKRETKAFALRKDKAPLGSRMIELAYEQDSNRVNNAASHVLLGMLEVVRTDELPTAETRSHEDGMMIQQLVVVLTQTLCLVRQTTMLRKLEDSIQQLELKSAAHSSEWKQHVSARFKQILTLQTKVNKLVSAVSSSESSEDDQEIWLQELLGVVETSIPSRYKEKKYSGDGLSSGPRLVHLRSFLLFEGAHNYSVPPLLHSCKKDCRTCVSSTVLANVHELEALEENGDGSGFALGLREAASGEETLDATTRHPALSLLLPECHVGRQREQRWELDVLHDNSSAPSTHELVVKALRRAISATGALRVVLVGVAERSVEIEDTSSSSMLSFCGEMVLDAAQRLLHTRALHEQRSSLSGELLRAEQALVEPRQAQAMVANTLNNIGSVCLATIDLETSASNLIVLLGKLFQTVAETTVHVHVCARVTSSDPLAQWEVVGGKIDAQATQELLQVIKGLVDTSADHRESVMSDDNWKDSDVEVKMSDGVSRLVYRLFDDKNNTVGALVLDGDPDCLVQMRSKLAGPVKAVLQVAAAAAANLRNKLEHEVQMQKLLNERDQLLLDKCQLELNSLEMKNLLHNNEAHLLSVRSHFEQVVHPTNNVVHAFLFELKDLKTPRDVILGLGQAITSLADVTGVQFTVIHKNKASDNPPTLFSSIVKDEDKRVLRSHDVQDAIQKCAKQLEMIHVCVDRRADDARCSDATESSAHTTKRAILYPMTVPQDVEARKPLECAESAAAEPCPAQDLVVIVLAISSKPLNVPEAAGGKSTSAYQFEQVKLLIHLAMMHCQSLTQRDLWKQQLEFAVGKERNVEDHINLLNLKCNQWRDRHDLQTQLQSGLVHQLTLGLPSLYAGANRALSSKEMLSMWQALLEILCSRLEGALRKRKAVARSSVQLFGAVQEANFFFSFGKSTGAKRLQLMSFQQCARDPSHLAIWKALVNETIANVNLREGQTSSPDAAEAMRTVFPIMGITGDDDQGHESVVGVLEFQSEQPLDDNTKDEVQEFLTWFSPAVACIGRSVYRKMLKKHASRHPVGSTSSDPHRQRSEMAYASNHGTSVQALNLASTAMLSGLPNHIEADAFLHVHDDARARSRMEADSVSTVEYAEGDDGGDIKDEARALRKKREKLLPDIVTLLLELQEANDVRSLAKVVQHEIKRLWPLDVNKPEQSIQECLLFCCENSEGEAEQPTLRCNNNADPKIPHWISDLMKSRSKTASTPKFQVMRGVVPTLQYESGEQYRLILLPASSQTSRSSSCLVITGASLDTLFNAEDERVLLPQIARCVYQQLCQLATLAKLEEEVSQLGETKHQEATLIAQASELEKTVADISGFLVFQSALNGIETERALSSLVTEYLKNLLQCERVVFQVIPSSSRAGEEPGHPFAIEDGTVALGKSTLEMDNILVLRVFSPQSNGSELLAVCTARMGAKADLLDAHRRELLRRVSPLIGSVMHRIHVDEKLSHQVRVNDNAQAEVERLIRENRELHSQLQQQSHSREHFDTRLGNQEALVAENKRLEAQGARMTSQLDAFTRERDEQQFELAAREKVIAKLTFQLNQFTRVEAQIQQVDDENSALRHREKKLEKKILKQRLQLQQLVSEVGQFKQKEEFDRHEIAQLQRQLAVLNEKQRQLGTAKESSMRSQSSRYFQHMQHQVQKRKQESLAQELRQLTAMEIREMKFRNREQRGRT